MNRETRIFILGILGTLFFCTILAVHLNNAIKGEYDWTMWASPIQLILCGRCVLYVIEKDKK